MIKTTSLTNHFDSFPVQRVDQKYNSDVRTQNSKIITFRSHSFAWIRQILSQAKVSKEICLSSWRYILPCLPLPCHTRTNRPPWIVQHQHPLFVRSNFHGQLYSDKKEGEFVLVLGNDEQSSFNKFVTWSTMSEKQDDIISTAGSLHQLLRNNKAAISDCCRLQTYGYEDTCRM